MAELGAENSEPLMMYFYVGLCWYISINSDHTLVEIYASFIYSSYIIHMYIIYIYMI